MIILQDPETNSIYAGSLSNKSRITSSGSTILSRFAQIRLALHIQIKDIMKTKVLKPEEHYINDE